MYTLCTSMCTHCVYVYVWYMCACTNLVARTSEMMCPKTSKSCVAMEMCMYLQPRWALIRSKWLAGNDTEHGCKDVFLSTGYDAVGTNKEYIVDFC